MRRRRGPERALAIACAAAAACGPSSPSAATGVSPPPAATAVVTPARILDVLDDSPIQGAIAAGDDVSQAISNVAGELTLSSAVADAEPHRLTIAAASFVGRQTYVRVPGAAAVLSLIPRRFDLASFDQMIRVSILCRWRTPPPLRIAARTFRFTSLADTALEAIDDRMTPAERDALVNDLIWALPQLTGDSFRSLASIATDEALAGEAVPLLNDGVITVARVAGLTAATGYWGYSRWRLASDGTVSGGLSLLDVDFERSGSPARRALRAHELGHSLGYSHVTARDSVMNPAARLEPNDFDRAASRIAFLRAPGNRAPDDDPAATSAVNRIARTWTAPIP